MTTGERIKAARKAKNITQTELGRACGTTKQTIFKYETGMVTNIPTDKMELIAKALDCTPAYIMGWDNLQPIQQKTYAARRIPVLGSIPAGIPIEAIQDIIDWEEIPDSLQGDYFALRVEGDSMYPEFLPDDIIIVRCQATCESGDDCVVYVNGYNATLKRVKLARDGSLTIHPINPSYPPRTYSRKEVAELPVSIAGVVVELRRKIKRL